MPTVRFNGKLQLQHMHEKKNPFHMVQRNHLYCYILPKLFNQNGWLGEAHWREIPEDARRYGLMTGLKVQIKLFKYSADNAESEG